MKIEEFEKKYRISHFENNSCVLEWKRENSKVLINGIFYIVCIGDDCYIDPVAIKNKEYAPMVKNDIKTTFGNFESFKLYYKLKYDRI